jgi:hypothetical protein
LTKNQWFGASFLVIGGSMAFMLVFAYTGLLMYQISFQQDQFAEGTHIAGVDVSDKNRVEAVNALNESVENWEQETEHKLIWSDEMVELPAEAVQILVEPTVDQTLGNPELTEADLLVSVDDTELRDAVQQFSFQDETVDFDELASDIEEKAGKLPEDGIEKEISPYLTSGPGKTFFG